MSSMPGMAANSPHHVEVPNWPASYSNHLSSSSTEGSINFLISSFTGSFAPSRSWNLTLPWGGCPSGDQAHMPHGSSQWQPWPSALTQTLAWPLEQVLERLLEQALDWPLLWLWDWAHDLFLSCSSLSRSPQRALAVSNALQWASWIATS